jgi:hypothetical protein
MKTYTFHVTIPGYGRMWRKVELAAGQTLEDLHFAIQNAFDFDADHLYSFFMSGKAWDTDSEYTLPEGADPWGGMIEAEEDEDFEEAEESQDLQAEDGAAQAPGLASPFDEATLHALLGDNVSLEDLQAKGQAMMNELFGGEDEVERDVRETTLESLALKPKQEFMYLFDYGDEWRFKVRVQAVNAKAPDDVEYPRLVESMGEAPRQYPDYDEDEDEDFEEDEE